jgi:uncharacterized protein
MRSCIYQGNVRHRRFEPIEHEFCYSIAYLYVDLAEWDEVIRRVPLLSGRKRWAVSSIRREDHLGDPSESLDEAVRREVEQQTGVRPSGRIGMLSQWRSFGFFFSPVNFFYCFGSDGSTVEAIIAEVNNTPWGEQHCYTLWQGNRTSDKSLSFGCDKVFHVSPFMALDLHYRWSLTAPADALTIHIQACREATCTLDSTLRLKRHELTAGRWLLNLARYPLVPPRILAGVHFEALRLWLKKAPLYAHPSKRSSPTLTSPHTDQPDSVNPSPSSTPHPDPESPSPGSGESTMPNGRQPSERTQVG